MERTDFFVERTDYFVQRSDLERSDHRMKWPDTPRTLYPNSRSAISTPIVKRFRRTLRHPSQRTKNCATKAINDRRLFTSKWEIHFHCKEIKSFCLPSKDISENDGCNIITIYRPHMHASDFEQNTLINGMTLFSLDNSIAFVFYRRLWKKIKVNRWFLQRI